MKISLVSSRLSCELKKDRKHCAILIFISLTSMLMLAFVCDYIDGIVYGFLSDYKYVGYIYLGLLITFLLILLFPVIHLFVKRISKLAFEYKKPKVWRILWIIPLIFTIKYNALFSGIEQARIAIHDLRHHFNAIMTYRKGNQQAKVQTYFEQYLSIQQDFNLTVYCENMAVTKRLSYYQTFANKNDIKANIIYNNMVY